MTISFEAAKDLESRYRPNQATRRKLARVTLVPFVGPTATGKNYQMRLMRDFGWYEVAGLTTRELRPNDLPELKHIEEKEMLRRITEQSLAQYAIGGSRIYATEPSDYRLDTPNMKDILSSVVGNFPDYGFGAVMPIAVLASPSDWQDRLSQRFAGQSKKDISERLHEAEKSLNWIIKDNPNDLPRAVIISEPTRDLHNVDLMQSYLESGEAPEPTNESIDVAHQMLDSIPKLREKYLEGGF